MLDPAMAQEMFSFFQAQHGSHHDDVGCHEILPRLENDGWRRDNGSSKQVGEKDTYLSLRQM